MGIWHSYGDVLWEIITEPTKAQDGSDRLFVWAKCVGRPERKMMRGRKPHRHPPMSEHVHFLPIGRFVPNNQMSDAASGNARRDS